jgi:hypothetical protein
MPLSHEELANKARWTHGLISHNAALADSYLYEVFHHFAGCERKLSRAIYFTLDSAPGRATLVRRVAAATGAEEETLGLVRDVGETVKGAIKHRNGFAHSFLLLEEDIFGLDDHIKVVNPKSETPGALRVTEQSLATAEQESVGHLRKAGKAFQSICQKLGIPPEVTI